ncbi:uncharacterized protein LOC111862205 [Cryptotermes secundus]|uniref:uncharacterized protein LOC111862205 n=1 Tax=Cryptotermes secundus TaxID=105785 RepID=UPI000CD7CD2A|nr:uncharacterized protein LOC111862205 [Cryptotermes secundus]
MEATPGRKYHNTRNHKQNSNLANNQKSHKRPNPAPFWNEDCNRLIRLRKGALLRLQQYPTRDNFLQYKKIEAKTRSDIRRIKRDYYRNFCCSLNRFTNQSYIWRKLAGLKRAWNTTPQSNEYNVQRIHTIETAIETLCPPWAPVQPPCLKNDYEDPFMDHPFTKEELEAAILSTNPKSSPGLDGIDYLVIRSLPDTVKPLLLRLYNDIYLTESFPTEWKQYSIFFIPKPDKGKVRPISLAACLLKIMEKMINMRLNWWLEYNHLLPPLQFGFRKNKSCLDNATVLYLDIINAFDLNRHLGAVFLDIQSAFDNVLADVLIERLKLTNLPRHFLAFIYNLVSERFLYLRYDNLDVVRTAYRGLPQGSVLSPILFALYMTPLNASMQGPCTVLQFADDIALYYSDKDPKIISTKLTQDIGTMNVFLENSGLKLAPDKCQYCLFSKNRTIRAARWEVTIGNAACRSVPVVKFLGILFESSLNWKQHLLYIRSKCIKPLTIISYLRSTWIGADPSILLRLYIALVRSRIEYGSHLFTPLNATETTSMERIQCKALRLAMGYMASTPTNVTQAEARIPPLDMRFKLLCDNYISRIYTLSNHPLLARISQLADTRMHPTRIHTGQEPLILTCYKEIEPLHHLIAHSDKPLIYSYPYKTSFHQARVSFAEGLAASSSPQGKAMIDSLVKELEGSNRCFFTDGSKTEGCRFVGFASVTSTNSTANLYRTSKYASVFTAEAMAIISTLEMIKQSPNTHFSLFSDSKSVLEALRSGSPLKHCSHLILTIKEQLLMLEEKGKIVHFYWIPAHIGITHNERADMAAKESVYKGIDSQLLLPWTDLRACWKQKMLKDFYAWGYSSGAHKGKYYFDNYFAEVPYPWFNKIKLHRKPIVTLNRLRAGHYCLKTHLHRLNIVPHAICDCGENIESPNHILWQCKRFDAAREDMLRNLIKRNEYPPYKIEPLLRDMDPGIIASIAHYLTRIDITI